ncbi:hypothetical protein [Arsukibacterium sp.]|uniref:hypothetical protein n=1 Tax=Arsukibacterium sp. TaxID=1977258 RepID=UPI002FD99A9E
MPANTVLSRTVKSLYFAVVVPGFGLLLGGVIFSMLSIVTAKEPLDTWALIGSQLAFGSLGALVVFTIAIVAYFIAISMAKLRLFNGI